MCVVMTLGSNGEKQQATQRSKLLDGSSEFVLTYEDKEGDWMLVGDVPWRYMPLMLSILCSYANHREERVK